VLSANDVARRLYVRSGFDSHIEVLAKRLQPGQRS
jgi:hypothetical protein